MGGGHITLTTLHRTPVSVKADSEDWKELKQNESTNVEEGFEIKFCQDTFHFRVTEILGAGSNDSSSTSEEVEAEKEKPAKNISIEDDDDNSVKPKPTGLKGKKRKLPDW